MNKETILQRLAEKNESLWKHVAFRIVRDKDIAEDILQESWRKILSSKVEFDNPEDWEKYFRKIVVNTALDFRKIAGRLNKRSAPLNDALNLPDHQDHPLDELLHGEKSTNEKKTLEEVLLLVAQLPKRQRDAISWLVLEEEPATLEQISREKGIAMSTLRSRVIGGIKRIQKNLRKTTVP